MSEPKLRKNKTFAIAFRAGALLFVIWGILETVGVFKNAFNPVTLLAYTIQSNILVAVFFGVLLARTVARVRGADKRPARAENPYGFFPRLSAHIAFAIFVTMLVFWCVLVPASMQGVRLRELLVLDNLTVHLFAPLLMLVEYLIFSERGKLKRCDIFLCAAIPYTYLAEAMTLGLTRTVRYDSWGSPSYYPYIFLDADRFGAGVILMVGGLTLFFLGVMFIWQRLDEKIAKKKKPGANAKAVARPGF
ncbi:MAG: Pr6Pr family membrane protein [Oscillospiraceae bacterium]|jgi:hypothetical protein|nr:Pr6Pr family membrane protein [Oscillospiraceae bacterium]